MNQSGILIVEADILVRSPLADYLRECGYQVMEAVDVAEARRVLGDASHQVDIVLADADAPGESAFALASWLRSNRPDIEVVLAGTPAKAVQKAGDLCREGPALTRPYDHQFVLQHIKSLVAARERHGRGN